MKLYVLPVAPNPTKPRCYVAEKGIEIEQVLVDLREGAQRQPEFRAKNPLGRLPVLELDDGECIAESLPIIEYLEELYPDPPMIGRTPLERLRVRSAERLVDTGVLGPAALVVHATRSPLGLPPRPEMAEFHRARLDEAPPARGREARRRAVRLRRPPDDRRLHALGRPRLRALRRRRDP